MEIKVENKDRALEVVISSFSVEPKIVVTKRVYHNTVQPARVFWSGTLVDYNSAFIAQHYGHALSLAGRIAEALDNQIESVADMAAGWSIELDISRQGFALRRKGKRE